MVNAVLWVLSTGEGWSKLPGRYPSPPTCRRRFDEWQADGTLAEVVKRLGTSGRQICCAGASAQARSNHPRRRAATVCAARSGPIRNPGALPSRWHEPDFWAALAAQNHFWRPLSAHGRPLAHSHGFLTMRSGDTSIY
ncbi:transposase [Burkholderia thailandensis]|uniref:transposase n=1 Tax=Burkholderia thailandensis TaxID=57975 RepID=UPI00192DD34C|nr:transposase [Burkholderia thailandensis]QRA09899.1 transposase [Burkholderia thailandensis]